MVSRTGDSFAFTRMGRLRVCGVAGEPWRWAGLGYLMADGNFLESQKCLVVTFVKIKKVPMDHFFEFTLHKKQ